MNTPEHGPKNRPIPLRLWLSAIDPGLIRLQAAGRSALALLSIWLLIRTGLRLLPAAGEQPLALLGILCGIVFLLFIIDLRPCDRQISLWMAPIPFAGAVILASYLSANYWLNNLVLLLFFFLSYFLRRYGARAGELALVTTVGYYLGFLLHPSQGLFPLFLVCVAASAMVVYLWQFVIIPYDPVKSLHRSVSAFYHNVARAVAITGQELESPEGNNRYSRKLQSHFRRVHLNRRVIEGLFSATVSPSLWSQARLNNLQEEMFKTERGLEQLTEAAIQLVEQRNKILAEVLSTLIEGLSLLENQLWEMASGKGQAQLTELGATLQAQLKSGLEDKTPGDWVYPLLRVGTAARQLSRSVAEIRTIEVAWKEGTTAKPDGRSPALHQSHQSLCPGKRSRVNLHPTTILGLQAVLAIGLAMLAAYLLDLDKPNLVYWTAFVVIAGSTGESLRRMALRVTGVIAGTVVGVFLAIVTPDSLPLVVLLATTSFFLTIYSITTSYVWMVFWLNIAVLLVITTLGGPALELLVLRPVSTLLGAAIAALVVVFVLPIHVQNRFIAALSEFLRAIDHYIGSYVAMLLDDSTAGDLGAEEMDIDTTFKKLELTLPAMAYEYNPMSRAQSQLVGQETTLAVLKSYVIQLNDEVSYQPGVLAGDQYAALIQTIQSQIHENLNALDHYLTQMQNKEIVTSHVFGHQKRIESAVDEVLTTGTVSLDGVGNRAVYQLARIHQTILQVASGLGVQTFSE
jgi:Fusaric acid resistance protein-like